MRTTARRKKVLKVSTYKSSENNLGEKSMFSLKKITEEEIQTINNRVVLHLQMKKKILIHTNCANRGDGANPDDSHLLIIYSQILAFHLELDLNPILNDLLKNLGSYKFVNIFNKYFSEYAEVIDESQKQFAEKGQKIRIKIECYLKQGNKVPIFVKSKSVYEDFQLLRAHAAILCLWKKLDYNPIQEEFDKAYNENQYIEILLKYFSDEVIIIHQVE